MSGKAPEKSDTSFVEVVSGGLVHTGPVVVPLPYPVRLRTSVFVWIFLVGAFAFGVFMLRETALLFVPGARATDWPTFLVILPLTAVAGTFSIAGSVIHALDLTRGSVVIIVEDAGIVDVRSTLECIPWSDIASIGGLKSAAPVLHLTRACVARRNPFRLGAARYLVRHRTNEIAMPLVLVREDYFARQVLEKLAARHGIEVRR